MTITIQPRPFTDQERAIFAEWTDAQLMQVFFTREEAAARLSTTVETLTRNQGGPKLPDFNRVQVRGRVWYEKAHILTYIRSAEYLQRRQTPKRVYAEEYTFLSSICGPQWAFNRLVKVYGVTPEHLRNSLREHGIEVPLTVMGGNIAGVKQ